MAICCKGITKKGAPCKNTMYLRDGYCAVHRPRNTSVASTDQPKSQIMKRGTVFANSVQLMSGEPVVDVSGSAFKLDGEQIVADLREAVAQVLEVEVCLIHVFLGTRELGDSVSVASAQGCKRRKREIDHLTVVISWPRHLEICGREELKMLLNNQSSYWQNQRHALEELTISSGQDQRTLDGGVEGEMRDEAMWQQLRQLESFEALHIRSVHSSLSLPSHLGQLRSLKRLSIKECGKLEELPRALGQLESLQELEIQGLNRLASIPVEVAQCKRLVQVKIQYCSRLESVPEELAQIPSLKALVVPNRLCSSLPDSLQGLLLNRRNQHAIDNFDEFHIEHIPDTWPKICSVRQWLLAQKLKYGSMLLPDELEGFQRCDHGNIHWNRFWIRRASGVEDLIKRDLQNFVLDRAFCHALRDVGVDLSESDSSVIDTWIIDLQRSHGLVGSVQVDTNTGTDHPEYSICIGKLVKHSLS